MDDEVWNSDEEKELLSCVPENPTVNRNRYNHDTRENFRNRGRGRGTGRGRGQQSYVNTNWRNKHENSDASLMEIQSSFVGRIIGRGGTKIRELQSDSGATIQIGEQNSSSGIVVISLFGTDEAKSKARELIELLVTDKPRKNPSPPPSFNGCSYNGSGYNGSSHSGTSPTEVDSGPIDWEKVFADDKRHKEELLKSLPPMNRDFYREDPEVAGMSERDVAAWRLAHNNISVQRICDDDTDITTLRDIPNPVQTFEQGFSTYPEILEEIRKQGFTTPSPIQAQAWPILLRGEDMIGIAQTGTGKTLAFLLPALIHIENQPLPMDQRDGPNVLVMAPTRELALQIEKEVSKYHYRGIKSVCLYGGGSRSEQIETVSKGVQIIIATPGRLNDLVKARHVSVSSVTFVVLDEADRMLDMGFGPQIRVSLIYARPDRQTVMTSATWPNDVQRLAQGLMKNPIQVVVGTLDLAAVHSVSQELIFFNNDDDSTEKFQTLIEFMKAMDPSDKLIVFCGRRGSAIAISADIALLGFHYQSIYGGLVQCEREQALEDMRTGAVNILIATDIASRGIDIENITHIINFDFPHTLEEFVHRVGRTGRAGRTGKAITYMTRRDWSKAAGLIDILEEAGQHIPQQLSDMAERFKKKQLRDAESGDGYSFRGRGRGRGRRY